MEFLKLVGNEKEVKTFHKITGRKKRRLQAALEQCAEKNELFDGWMDTMRDKVTETLLFDAWKDTMRDKATETLLFDAWKDTMRDKVTETLLFDA